MGLPVGRSMSPGCAALCYGFRPDGMEANGPEARVGGQEDPRYSGSFSSAAVLAGPAKRAPGRAMPLFAIPVSSMGPEAEGKRRERPTRRKPIRGIIIPSHESGAFEGPIGKSRSASVNRPRFGSRQQYPAALAVLLVRVFFFFFRWIARFTNATKIQRCAV